MKIDRRQFLFSSAFALAAPPPCRIGHRQASMMRAPGPAVFDLARRIPGLAGVELQVHFRGTTLWDRDTLMEYKRGAERAGLAIPSLAGVWGKGATLMQPGPAEDSIRKSVQAAAALGADVILVAAFKDNCPNMDREESYGPVVAMLQKVAPQAADAGVTLGMELSLSPEGNKKLIDLVNRPAVKVYYDAYNVEFYGHTGQGGPGHEALGVSRLARIHVKNEDKLLEEPGRVNWDAALKTIRGIGYKGWLIFESSHSGPDQCVESTTKNIAFIRRHGL